MNRGRTCQWRLDKRQGRGRRGVWRRGAVCLGERWAGRARDRPRQTARASRCRPGYADRRSPPTRYASVPRTDNRQRRGAGLGALGLCVSQRTQSRTAGIARSLGAESARPAGTPGMAVMLPPWLLDRGEHPGSTRAGTGMAPLLGGTSTVETARRGGRACPRCAAAVDGAVPAGLAHAAVPRDAGCFHLPHPARRSHPVFPGRVLSPARVSWRHTAPSVRRSRPTQANT